MWHQRKGFPRPHGLKSSHLFAPLLLLYEPSVSQPKPTPAATASTSSVPQDVEMDTSSPAAPPAAPPSSSTPAPVSVPDTASVTQPTTPAATPAATAPPAAAPAFGDMSTFLSGEALQSAINNMTEMGFPRDQVLRAMRASYNNADRAVEYLMTVRFVPGCLTNSTNELLGDSRPFGGRGCWPNSTYCSSSNSTCGCCCSNPSSRTTSKSASKLVSG